MEPSSTALASCERSLAVLILAALLGSCSRGPAQSGEVVLFIKIGNTFFQDSVSIQDPDGHHSQTLIAPEPSRSFQSAHGNSLKRQLVVLVHELTPDRVVENNLRLYFPIIGTFRGLPLPKGKPGSAAISPDETLLAFEFSAAGQQSGQLWLYDFHARSASQLDRDETAFDLFPAWSPDGKELLFLRTRFVGTRFETSLMAINLDERIPGILFGPSEEVSAASYGPNGDQFAIWSPIGLELVRRTSLQRRVIVPSSTLNGRLFQVGSLSWSRNENRIAFSVDNPGAGQSELWIVNVDGTQLRQVHAAKNATIHVKAFLAR